MSKTIMQKAIDLKNWETTISNMGQSRNELYAYTNLNNKYYRFIDNMKGWIQGLFGTVGRLNGEIENLEPKDMNEEQKATALFMKTNLTPLQGNWWEAALKGDEKQKEILPKIETALENEKIAETKEVVYENLLPAYRALKERFEKRWWIEFIFNHRQYTAERDALKVVTSMMLSMTGDSMEEVNEKYEAYKAEIITSDIAEMQRIEDRRVKFAEYAKGASEEPQEYLEVLQQIKDEEVKEIENKAADDLTMKDQFTICSTDETFKEKLKADLGEVVNALPDKRFAAVRKLMLNSHVMTPLLAEAEKLCNAFDSAMDDGVNKEGRSEVVKEGVANMFKAALNATKNIKITDAKERIIVAQKLTDIVLNSASPVSFRQNEYANYGKGFMVLRNEEVIRSAMSDVDAGALNEAIAGAKETFGALYPENNVQEIEKINVHLNEPKAQVAPPVDKNSVGIGERKREK